MRLSSSQSARIAWAQGGAADTPLEATSACDERGHEAATRERRS